MLALLLAFTVGFSVESWQSNKGDQVRQLSALTEMGAASLDTYFVQYESAVRLASREIFRDGTRPETALSIRNTLRKMYPELRSLSFTTGHGGEHAVAGTSGHRPYLRPVDGKAPEPSRVTIEPATWSPHEGDWVIPVRYAVRDDNGAVVHAIEGALPMLVAYRLWKDAPLPDGARLGVMHDRGYLMALYPLPDAASREGFYGAARPGSPLYQHIRDNNGPARGMVHGPSSSEGSERLWVYRRLDHFPLSVYTSMPRSFLWRTWWQQVRYSYLLLALGMLGGGLAYGWTVRRQLAWEVARLRTEKRIRRLNKSLAQRVAQLQSSNKELEAFSYTVSHDLRGPLRVIHGFSERLAAQAGPQLDAQSLHCLNRITVGAQRMGELVDGLLHLSRVTRVKIAPQPVDLTHHAKSIVRELQQLFPQRTVRFTVEEGLSARGNPALLRDLLRNLLENAWKFTAAKANAAVSVYSEIRDGERVFVVRDNGVGFDMQYAGKLFTTFHRLHGGDYEGVGIGLATAARITAMHGGRIWADAVKNEGAAFHFVLEPRA